jgi:hypothetical protein
MYLNASTDKLEIVLSGAVATNQLQWNVSWQDITSAGMTLPQSAGAGNTNNTTAVQIVGAPASSTTRQVTSINIYNADTSTSTVIVRKDVSGSKYVLVKYAVTSGDTLMWSREYGWRLLSVSGGGGGGSGTVTSVELIAGDGISLSGTNPITSSGAITITNTRTSIPHATASGTDTYSATVTGVAAYNDGDAYIIQFTNGNTTTATLDINTLGAVALYRNNDGPLIGGDIWDNGEMICVYDASLPAFRCMGTSPNSLFSYVTNADSVTITKGQPVYAFGGTGDRLTVKRANNTSDTTSAQTVGLVYSTSIAAGQKGIIIMQGLLDGLSILPTSTWSDGSPVYLGATAGAITPTKQYAPNHLVYLGFVTTASNGSAGRMYVKIQNGYELDELHNVQAQSPTLKDTLYYDNTVSPAQWKTASIATILGYTPGHQYFRRHYFNNSTKHDYLGYSPVDNNASATWTITDITVAANGTTTKSTATGQTWPY